jgi:hypothetical protein
MCNVNMITKGHNVRLCTMLTYRVVFVRLHNADVSGGGGWFNQ